MMARALDFIAGAATAAIIAAVILFALSPLVMIALSVADFRR